MTFVLGHLVAPGVAIEFRHLCPGEGCAIARWLVAQYRRQQAGA